MKSVSRKGFLVRGTTTQEVAISMEDAFWVLERGLGFTDAYSLGVRDGKLVRAEDMSHHGSPEYAFTELSNNPKWACIFRPSESKETVGVSPPSREKQVQVHGRESTGVLFGKKWQRNASQSAPPRVIYSDWNPFLLRMESSPSMRIL